MEGLIPGGRSDSVDSWVEEAAWGRSAVEFRGSLFIVANVQRPSDDESGIAFIQYAIDRGVNFLDSSDAYGNGQNETLLAPTALALTDFAIGDEVVVEMSNGRRYSMTIVGAVRDQNAEPSINSGGINLYTTLDTFEWLGEITNWLGWFR